MQHNTTVRPKHIAVLLLTWMLAASAAAEQYLQAGPYRVHYIVLPTTLLNADIAKRYDIVRGRNRGLLNLSVLDANGSAVPASISGTMLNLPGQVLTLRFNEVVEDNARYHLATFRFSDDELLRFRLDLVTDSGSWPLRFQQKLNWEE